MYSRVVTIDRTFTGDYEKDNKTLIEIAEDPVTAAFAAQRAEVVMNIHHKITYGTPSAPNYPERAGMARKVFDELFPIAHFANLYYCASEEVTICWKNGGQNFDATVDDKRNNSVRSSIRYLEVTTLQDRQDSELLTQLAENGTFSSEGDSTQLDHERKITSLRTALEKKGKKKYPPETALLVYTDEGRFQRFSYGAQSSQIDVKKSFSDVVNEMKHLLTGFSQVFIYSKNEIYSSITTNVRQ